MTATRKDDLIYAGVVSLGLPLAVLAMGAPLSIGVWYSLLAPAAAIALSAVLRAPPLFTAGAAVALAVTFAGYWAWALSLSRPEGLLGLGHLFSLPGAAIGLLAGAWFARRKSSASAAFVAALAFTLTGFMLNQLVTCNTVLWCGPLSLPVH